MALPNFLTVVGTANKSPTDTVDKGNAGQATANDNDTISIPDFSVPFFAAATQAIKLQNEIVRNLVDLTAAGAIQMTAYWRATMTSVGLVE